MNIPEFDTKDLYSELYANVMVKRSGGYRTKDIIKELADIAYNFPIDSEEFEEGMRLIKSLDGYNGYILCFDRNWEEGNIPDDEITRLGDDSRWESILSPTHTFCESQFYHDRTLFKRRSEVEHDVRYRQVCVGALITDGTNIICLKTHNRGRLPNQYTLIQGHIDFDKSAYTTSQTEFIKNNVIREIYEETKIKNPTGNDMLIGVPFHIMDNPDFIINTKRTLTNLEHMGFIYVLRVDSCEEVMGLIESNEPTKHDVVMLPREIIADMDNWIMLVIAELNNVPIRERLVQRS